MRSGDNGIVRKGERQLVAIKMAATQSRTRHVRNTMGCGQEPHGQLANSNGSLECSCEGETQMSDNVLLPAMA